MKGRFSVLLLIPLAFGVWYLTGMLKHAHAPVTSGSGIPVITSSVVSTAIAYERKQLGCPYVYGADGPCSKGFDCSSLVQQAYAHARDISPPNLGAAVGAAETCQHPEGG